MKGFLCLFLSVLIVVEASNLLEAEISDSPLIEIGDLSLGETRKRSSTDAKSNVKPVVSSLSLNPSDRIAPIAHQHSLNEFSRKIINPRIFRSEKRSFTSPRISPILKLLDLIDKLLGEHFELVIGEQRIIMSEPLKLLRTKCDEYNRLYGPLNPKSRNCAFRLNELVHFIKLITKYRTNSPKDNSGKLPTEFHLKLIKLLKKLIYYVDDAFQEFSHFITEDEEFLERKSTEFRREIIELVEILDSIESDLAFYCTGKFIHLENFQLFKNSFEKFLKIAFI